MIFIKIIFSVGKTALCVYVSNYVTIIKVIIFTLRYFLSYEDLRKVYRNLRFITQTQKV